MSEIRLMSPGKNGMVTNEFGLQEKPPVDWEFLKAGDAATTRKVTSLGPIWRIQVKKGRRIQSLGIWAPKVNIQAALKEVALMRAAPDYEQKKASAAKSRAKKQEIYTVDFQEAVAAYLNFHKSYKDYESQMSALITAHATPVGSGTVARTQMIPIAERAGKAVIAWMRHQTTNYDHMKIARIKGERRSVRKQLAANSLQLLKKYRSGEPIAIDCPLFRALKAAKG